MLITFKSSAHADIIMFGDVGLKLLEMMDFGQAIPGAIGKADVAQALENLEQALRRLPEEVEAAGAETDDDASTTLHTRALPLLDLLRASAAADKAVSWE